MNEQELMIKKKIEKREKVDTILAYILLVIITICIIIVVYIKFFREDEVVENNEYTANYITLNEISSALANSNLASQEGGATLNSTSTTDMLTVDYSKESRSVRLDIPLNINELAITIDEENEDMIEEVYKEIAVIVCQYYGNDVSACRNTIAKVDANNQIDGIRFEEVGDTTTVYLDINKKISVNNIQTYNSVEVLELNNTNYILNLNNVIIDAISVNVTDNNISVAGSIEDTSTSSEALSVVVKLYDENENILGENKYDFTNENPLTGVSNFTVEFTSSETLNIANVKKYSIEVSK